MAAFLSDKRCTEIVVAMRDYGLKVVEDPGWRQRGTGRTFAPYGNLVHHDATTEAMSDARALEMMRKGHSRLSGPLCNSWIDSDSTVYLVAAGNANHAGKGRSTVLDRIKANLPPRGDARGWVGYDDMVGNPYLWGFECRNAGDGRDVWEQLYAMEAACAAVSDVFGWTNNATIAHREWTARKPDPAGIDMDLFRSDMAQIRTTHEETYMDPAVLTVIYYWIYLQRLPSLAEIAGGVANIKRHGQNAYMQTILDSEEFEAKHPGVRQ